MDFIRDKKTSTKLGCLINILHNLHGQLSMVQYLTLSLKADNVEVCFIYSGISFYNLGVKLDIVSIPKCPISMFPLAK